MKGFFDNVMERAVQLVEHIEDSALKMAGDKPVGVKELSGREVYDVFSGLQPDQLDSLAREYGEDVMNNVLFDVYKAGRKLKPEAD